MSEKVLHEVRVIETDDGYRIEIKGDKERLKELGLFPPMGFGNMFGRRGRKHRHEGRGRRHHFGPRFGHWRQWADFWEEDEAPAEEEPTAKA